MAPQLASCWAAWATATVCWPKAFTLDPAPIAKDSSPAWAAAAVLAKELHSSAAAEEAVAGSRSKQAAGRVVLQRSQGRRSLRLR